MADQSIQRRLAAILAADVVGRNISDHGCGVEPGRYVGGGYRSAVPVDDFSDGAAENGENPDLDVQPRLVRQLRPIRQRPDDHRADERHQAVQARPVTTA